MNFFSILTLLGGLAMFLYGMQVMGDGLAKVSGGKLEQILENLKALEGAPLSAEELQKIDEIVNPLPA